MNESMVRNMTISEIKRCHADIDSPEVLKIVIEKLIEADVTDELERVYAENDRLVCADDERERIELVARHAHDDIESSISYFKKHGDSDAFMKDIEEINQDLRDLI